MTTPRLSSVLADLILVIHFVFVVFNIGGFVLIWIGYFRGWTFVRNLTFRIAHLLAMSIVALQAVAGMNCPLTVWENALRKRAGQSQYSTSFIEEWLGRLLFYEVNEHVLTSLYIAFFALVAFTLWRVPPQRKCQGDASTPRDDSTHG